MVSSLPCPSIRSWRSRLAIELGGLGTGCGSVKAQMIIGGVDTHIPRTGVGTIHAVCGAHDLVKMPGLSLAVFPGTVLASNDPMAVGEGCELLRKKVSRSRKGLVQKTSSSGGYDRAMAAVLFDGRTTMLEWGRNRYSFGRAREATLNRTPMIANRSPHDLLAIGQGVENTCPQNGRSHFGWTNF